ncbi:acyl-CoA carboxylase epsilon subunit [Streptomyces sp. NPDC059506]|uniref:acyl-CoA carboxylase epsilon subunit n=1 Tax=Streptomyces sp. NPDC059506 TaxID=3347751 RepID=UPI0036C2683F
MTADREAAAPPVVRVHRGDPTLEELAAVTAVLLAARRAADSTPEPPPRPAGWRRPERQRSVVHCSWRNGPPGVSALLPS